MAETNIGEIIATETNIKTLEVYRDDYGQTVARIIDGHLADLSRRILDALGEMPDFDLPEQPVSGPPTEQEITPPSPAGAAEELPGAPISGDAPALFNESNECITTTVQQQAPTGPDVDDATGSPGRGGEPAAPEVSNIGKQLKAWLDEKGLSVWAVAKQGLIDVTATSLHNIVTGKTAIPSEKNAKEILRVIRPKKKKVAPAPEPKTNGSAKPNGEGPGKFVSMKLLAWMGRNKYGVKDAAEHLKFTETAIRSIQGGNLPPSHMLTLLAREIPDIRNNLHDLKAAVENGAAG